MKRRCRNVGKIALDPFAVFRSWVGEWEKLVNTHGAEWLLKPEVAKAIQQMSSARLQAQAGSDEAIRRVLAAASMPSKADIEAIGARLAQIEATLARIEANQRGLSSGKPGPALKRTRRPAG